MNQNKKPHGNQTMPTGGAAKGPLPKIVFRTEDGNIEPELFRRTAEAWAEHVHSSSGRDANKYTQLYRFYDEVLRIQEEVQGDEERFKAMRAHLNMIYARASYASGRKLVTDTFLKMLGQCLDETKTAGDLDIFANFFEAFMGFMKERNPK